MSAIHIRDALPSDQERIHAVTLAAYRQYADPMGDHWQMYELNIVDTLADPRPAQQLVAEDGAAILGAVLLYPFGFALSDDGILQTTSSPEVRLLAVVPGGRGRGIGEALMRECIRRARASAADALTLHTTDLMHAAMRLYTRMGFVRAAELDFPPIPGLIARGYRLNLQGVG
ncbi:MAG TPA: GNAT family N-acetyltransferase [Candidatus Binatia bacterium]|nr:GNAT family N-acetyltransferase [Candidatus Binatia bacterium]